MSDEKASRLYFWDNAKGVLIFLVVFGHFLFPYRDIKGVGVVFDLIYLFHMPAFIFISGYLSRLVSDSRKSILKLCCAYFIFNSLIMVYGVLYDGLEPSLLTPCYSYWYILALVAWRLITPTLARAREVLPFCIVLAVFIGFWDEVNNMLALSRIVGFFPFFLAGYMFSEQTLMEFLSQRKRLHVVLGFCLLAISLYLGWQLSLSKLYLADLSFLPYKSPDRVFCRLIILLIAFVIMLSMSLLLPQRRIRVLTKWGKNSFSIYVLHRYIPFLFFAFFPYMKDSTIILSYSFFGSLLTLFILGFDRLTQLLNYILNVLADAFLDSQTQGHKAIRLAFFLFLLFHFVLAMSLSRNSKEEIDRVYPLISPQQQAKISNAVSIAFVGDLILLRDQVREAYHPETQDYDFDPMFSYAKKYFCDSDFAIGVLEGPLAGEEKGFSTSNYEDEIPLYLNFPESFVDSIKKSGIDLVTIANNHIMDMGIAGVMKTLEVLAEKEIAHVGAYRNIAERNTARIIDIKGLRVAVLSYTFHSNYYSEDYFFETNRWVTSLLVAKTSPYFDDALAQIRSDFKRAKAENPDFIVVLPHMGTQFIHKADEFQETWNDIFLKEGADVILADHSHAVQPVEFRLIVEGDHTRQAVIVNSPGNFVNSYVDFNGDATSIVKIYLDPDLKTVLCAGIVPMWTQALRNGQHRALPIQDILFDPSLEKEISLFEMRRIKEVFALVTEVMLGAKLSLDQSQAIYYLFPDGYYRQPVASLDLDSSITDSEVYAMFKRSSSVLFVGDSVTHGSKNGGYGWFEPLTASLPELKVAREAWGGATTHVLLENLDRICAHDADLYVIAIGTNDIRYRDSSICAMTSQQFVKNIDKLAGEILKKRPAAKFVFVAPWPSLPTDPLTRIPIEQRASVFLEYTKALHDYCQQKGYLFTDPSSTILSSIDQRVSGYYLLDFIHPNAAEGINLFSRAFLKSAK
ncbi:MAG: CapA family protein [Candidatus Riflebacteria bacterium]|nr:CapA family protein [Candidatus Riflebacteria bacterium]